MLQNIQFLYNIFLTKYLLINTFILIFLSHNIFLTKYCYTVFEYECYRRVNFAKGALLYECYKEVKYKMKNQFAEESKISRINPTRGPNGKLL